MNKGKIIVKLFLWYFLINLGIKTKNEHDFYIPMVPFQIMYNITNLSWIDIFKCIGRLGVFYIYIMCTCNIRIYLIYVKISFQSWKFIFFCLGIQYKLVSRMPKLISQGLNVKNCSNLYFIKRQTFQFKCQGNDVPQFPIYSRPDDYIDLIEKNCIKESKTNNFLVKIKLCYVQMYGSFQTFHHTLWTLVLIQNLRFMNSQH